MRTISKLLATLMLLFMCACGPNYYPYRYAYIAPHSGCYVVIIGCTSPASDETISRCVDIDRAREIADGINRVMGKDWSAETRY